MKMGGGAQTYHCSPPPPPKKKKKNQKNGGAHARTHTPHTPRFLRQSILLHILYKWIGHKVSNSPSPNNIKTLQYW